MKIKRNDSEESRRYWEFLEENAKLVSTWPEWKRGARPAIPETLSMNDECSRLRGGSPKFAEELVRRGCDHYLRSRVVAIPRLELVGRASLSRYARPSEPNRTDRASPGATW